ncbi:hypothetical protein ABTX81_39480 [Kitasatospora sp. NPDC097605]|uniref:hypothetical protein n=1 Tax=Kitasatospora sp. NPDC097605 TaxID=3157226 RepID=UPI00332326CD
MNTTEPAAPARPSRSEAVLVRGTFGVGALTVLASLLLIAGAFAADARTGENWQPAGVLGSIGLLLGGTILAVGVLARSVAARTGR